MAQELRVGLAGLGAAARIVLPGLNVLPNTRLTAVADIRPDEVERFQEKFDVEGYTSVDEMCARGSVDVVYVATPNQTHAEHTITAANHGKHVICEKPMAINMEEANRMIDAVERNGVQYVQGHSKIFRPVFFKMAEIIQSGRLGKVIHMNTFNYNDWMRRPSLACEVDEKMGGGVVFRQGPHQMDIIRFLGGGMIKTLRGTVKRAFPLYEIESNYSAFLTFDNGATALIDFNGLGYFDVAEMSWGIGEGGGIHREEDMTGPRLKTSGAISVEERYASPQYQFGGPGHQGNQQRLAKNQDFFGITIVSCERGDIRQSPEGLYVYAEDGREEVEVDADINTRGFTELRELTAALEEKRPVFPNHLWGRASLEGCVAMIESSREGREVELEYQVPSPLGSATKA